MNSKIIIVIVAIVAVAAIGGWYLTMNKSGMSNKMESQNNSTQTTNQQEGVLVGGALMTPDKDIVDNAVNSADHTTLVAAVQAAGLAETLKEEGPFTVFAPTNTAFEKLPAGTIDTLLKPENKDQLTNILTYHVVPGEYRSSDLKDGMTLTTVQGENLTFTMKDGKWWINGTAMIEIPDVISSNGVTYVIDSVLMPKN